MTYNSVESNLLYTYIARAYRTEGKISSEVGAYPSSHVVKINFQPGSAVIHQSPHCSVKFICFSLIYKPGLVLDI